METAFRVNVVKKGPRTHPLPKAPHQIVWQALDHYLPEEQAQEAARLAAVAVAILICAMSWRLGSRTIDTLMDRAPKGATEAIREAVQAVPGVVALDAATFLISAAALAAMRLTEPRPHPSDQHVLAEAAAGGRHLMGSPVLRATVVSIVCASVARSSALW